MRKRYLIGKGWSPALALLALALAFACGGIRASAGLASASPTVSWQGVDDQATDPEQTPPSATGAIGTARYVEFASGSYGIYDRAPAHTKLASGDLATFAGVPDDFLAEPQVIWDPDTSRFYFAALDLSENRYVYGFSQTASPSSPSDWCVYNGNFGFGSDFYPAELHLGDTQDFLLLGVDAYSWSTETFDHSEIDWVTKPPSGSSCPAPGSLPSGSRVNLVDASGRPAFSPVPVNQIDASSTGWIVAADLATGTELSLFQVTKSGSSASISSPGSGVPVTRFSPPPAVPQTGTPMRLNALDGRLTQAVSAVDPLRGGGAIWTQHTVAGGAGSEIHWYEINPASAALFQSGVVTDRSVSVFNGAISPDRVRNGGTSAFGSTMGLGFETSSSRTSPALAMVAKVGNNPQQAFVPVPLPGTSATERDYSCDTTCDWGTIAGATPDPGADTGKPAGVVWFTNAWAVAPPSNTSAADAAANVDWRTWNWSAQLATPPSIAGLSASSGPTGSTVTITGAQFTGVYQVTFGGVPASFRFVGDTAVTATVPAGALTGKVALSTFDGTAVSGATFVVQPTLRSFSPPTASAGAVLTISGSGFSGVNDVSFNGLHVAPTSVTPTSIHVAVPGNASTGPITISAPGGGTATSSRNFVMRSSITGFSVGSGVWGTAVTILGGGFVGATGVQFNGVGATFSVVDGGHISTTVPIGSSTGRVTVVTSGGSVSSSASFLVPPQITGFSPGSAAARSIVHVTGMAFTGASAVTVNGVRMSFRTTSPTTLDLTVPTNASDGKIAVTSAGGTATSAGTLKILPSITGVSPTAGTAGSTLRISGAGLAGALSVDFNGTAATFSGATATSLSATVPAGATTGPVHVVTPNGTAASATFTVRPGISGFSVPGGVWGSHVTVLGAGLAGATGVTVNTSPATFSVVDGGHIDVTVPAGSSTGPVTVTTAGASARSSANFLVLPTLSSVAPGSATVGATLTLTGTAFAGASTVTVSGLRAVFHVVSPTSITATVPGGVTDGPVAVTTRGGTATSATSFLVLPSITAVSPVSARAGSTVSISGGGLGSTSAVDFNGTPASAPTIVSPSLVRVTVPGGAASGTVHLTNAHGSTGSPSTFTVKP